MNPFPLFENRDLQSQLERKGYVVVDFMDEEGLTQLDELFKRYEPDFKYRRGMHQAFISGTPELRNALHHDIARIFTPYLNKLNSSYQPVNANMMIKATGVPNNSSGLHQDVSFSDESRGILSYSVWAPLVDTTLENGGMAMLPGSHKIFSNPRFIPSLHEYNAYGDFTLELVEYMEDLNIKRGQAAIWDGALVHGSFPNSSPHIRPAAVTNLIPKSEPLKVYFPTDDAHEEFGLFNIDHQTWLHTSKEVFLEDHAEKREPSWGQLDKKVKITKPALSWADIELRIQQEGIAVKTSKIKSYLDRVTV